MQSEVTSEGRAEGRRAKDGAVKEAGRLEKGRTT